jgi:hypothetical protein
MCVRVIALFLAFVLLWSSLSTIEAPSVFSPPATEQQLAIAHSDGEHPSHDGSVEDHYLDDQPSQAQNQNDPPTDTPGLPPAPLKPRVPALPMGPPLTFVLATAGSPFVEGPLRPPRDTALAG